VLTAAFWNTNVRDNSLALPRGYVGLTTLATTFTTTSGSPVDVTGLSITFTAEASRRYKISVFHTGTNSGTNANQIYIVRGATGLAETFTPNIPSTVGGQTFAVDSPTAGSVTYKVQLSTSGGTGTLFGVSTRASLATRLLVEDIGIA
jgi:hypothetical protein